MRRLALGVLAALLAVCLFADCMASDRPIVLSLAGETYWFPNAIDYDELVGLRGADLEDRMTEDDWAVWPPIRYSPTNVRTNGRLEVLREPSGEHLLGTDDRGRDVLARLIHGTRATFAMAAGTAALAAVLGLLLALAAAGLGGPTDVAIVSSIDAVTAIPALLVVVAAQGLLGTSGIAAAIVIVALPRAADTARLVRVDLLRALSSPFCDAARALGADRRRVLFGHALPHAWTQLAVASALTASTAVLAEAALSFLGFGTPPPTASWGELLKQAFENDLAWWLVVPSGLAVAVVAGALGALAQPATKRS